jgi:hypothetical protein
VEKLAAIRLGFDRVGITEAGVITAGRLQSVQAP